MHLSKKDKFLEEVLSYIKFPFDRNSIRKELQNHIDERITDYIEQGNDAEEAELLAVNAMGSAKEVGTELNKQHNPIIGWVWKITNIIVVLFSLICLYFVGLPLAISLFSSNPIAHIDQSSIAYRINIDRRVKLDDTMIHFSSIIYQKNGSMNIIYDYYDTKHWSSGWSLGTIGIITDDLGTKYLNYSGGSSSGIKQKCYCTIYNFSKKATKLIISYDNFNRKYEVEIPIKAGDHIE